MNEHLPPPSGPLVQPPNGHNSAPLAPHAAPTPEYAAPVPLGRYWLRAFRGPLLVALCCGLGAWLACTFLLTKWYAADTTLYFASAGNSSAASILTEVTGGAPVSADGTVPFMQGLYNVPRVGSGPSTAMMAMASQRCTRQVLTECRLPQRWHLSPSEASKRLTKNVSYGVNKNGLLSVAYTDTDPKLAVDVVNAYVRSMQAVTTELSVFYARRIRTILENKLAQREALLQTQRDELVSLQTRAAKGGPAGATSAADYARLDALRRADEVELARVQAQIDRATVAAMLAAKGSGTLPAEAPFAQTEGQKLRDLQSKLADAEDTLGPDNPDLLSLRSQVAQAKAQYERDISNQLQSVQQGIAPEVAALYVAREGLRGSINRLNTFLVPLRVQLTQSMPKVAGHQMRLAQLESSIKINQSAVNAMTLETDRARDTESRTVPAFEVVDGAAVPSIPALPRTNMTTALAAIAGFLIAFAWRVTRAVSRHPSVAHELQRLAQIYDIAPAAAPPSLPASAVSLNSPDRAALPHAAGTTNGTNGTAASSEEEHV